MPQQVEIVVPPFAREPIEHALGARPAGVTFRSTPSSRTSVSRVFMASLEDMQHQEQRERIASLWAETAAASSAFVILALHPGGAASWSSLIVQFLLECSSRVVSKKSPVPFVAPDAATVRRLVLARRNGAEDQLIATASVEDGTLQVWSCEPKLYSCPTDKIPALAALPAAAVKRVEVSESGSRLHWDENDIDLDLDTVRFYADPAHRVKLEQSARREAARYAKAIQVLREERGLRQADIAGISEREVRRLEKGETIPQAETLRKLAAAHDMEINDYLSRLAEISG